MIEGYPGTNAGSSKSENIENENWFENVQIFVAIHKGKLKKVKALLENGIKTDITNKNNKDNTPLHYAVDIDKKEIVAELLNPKWNTNINQRNADGETPLDIANRKNHSEIVKLLQNQASCCGVSLMSEHNTSRNCNSELIKKSYNSLTFKKAKGTSGIAGQLYEINLSILLLLKATTKESVTEFFLASNMEKAGKFDDIVFKYQNTKGKSTTVFLQSKHKEDDEKADEVSGEGKKQKKGDKGKKQKKGDEGKEQRKVVNLNKLLSKSESGDYSLLKYFRSYLKIKQNFKDNTDPNDPIFSGNFDECEFILYTNAVFDYCQRNCIKEFEMDENDLLQIPDSQGKYFQLELNSDKKDVLFSLLTSKNSCGSNLPNDDHIGETEVQDFLVKFKFYAFQPNEKALEKGIKAIAQEFYKIDQQDIHPVFVEVQHEIRNWWQGKNNYLTKENKYFESAARVSVQFDVKEPVHLFTGKVKELAELHKILHEATEAVESQIAAITGLGGVGKSELARKYLSEYKKYYDNNVIWINADNSLTIADSFRRLAREKFGISTCNEKGQEKDIKLVTEDVYSYFAKGKRNSIFVFDNAEKYKIVGDARDAQGIDKFLPQFGSYKPFVLITSRDREWGNIKNLSIGVFTGEEATNFIKNALNGILKVEDRDAERLAEELDHLPLALSQAVAYISVETLGSNKWSIEKSFTISSYLEIFKNHAHELLNSASNYSQPVLTTWKMTKSLIAAKSWGAGDLALESLYVMAYLAPNQISIDEIFITGLVIKEALYNAIELLHQYSMVQLHGGKVNIHRLVQQVTRLELEERSMNEEIIKITYKLLMGSFPCYSFKTEDINKKQRLLPHFEVFLLHMDDFLKNEPEEKRREIELYYHQNLLNAMAEGYRLDPKKEKKLLERLLRIQENHLGPDHDQVADTLSNMASASLILGNAEQSKLFIERAVRIMESHYGHDYYRLSRPLTNLSDTFRVLGDKEKSVQLLERVLKIQEKHYGQNHENVADTLSYLGGTCRVNGDAKRSKLLLEQALAIQEKHCGPNHYEATEALINLAHTYRDLGDAKKSKLFFERALPISENLYGFDHYMFAKNLTCLGNVCIDLGDVKESKRLLERAMKILEKYNGPDRYHLPKILSNLSKGFRNLGDTEKSKMCLERALTITEDHYGTDHYEVAEILHHLGCTCSDGKKSKQLLERALAINENHYGPDHYQVAEILKCLGHVNTALGDVKKSKRLLEHAMKILEKYNGPDRYNLPKILNNLSKGLSNLGETEKSKMCLERALAISEDHYGTDHYKVAEILKNLADTYSTLGDAEKSGICLERALTISEDYYGADHYKVAEILTNLADTYLVLGDAKNSTQLLERALTINEDQYGSDHFKVVSILEKLGDTYRTLGDAEKSKQSLERALPIVENHYGSDHYQVAEKLTELAHTYSHLGNKEKSQQLLERALPIVESHCGADHYKVASILDKLGDTYRTLGDAEKSKQSLERALPIVENHYGPYHYQVAEKLTELAHTYSHLGDEEKSKQLLERALPIVENHYGADHNEVALILLSLGTAYFALNDAEKSKQLLERALPIAENHCGPDHIQVGLTLSNLCNAYSAVDEVEKSKPFLKRSLTFFKRNKTVKAIFRHYSCDTMQALIKEDLDVLERDDHDTILHKVVSSKNAEMVKLILNAIIEKDPRNFAQHINAKDSEGDTPLMWAAQNGHTSAAVVLVEYGADINAQNENGETALHWATKGSFQELVQLLINQSANPIIKDVNKRTPFDLAQEKLFESTDNLETDLLIASLLRSVMPSDQTGRS